MRFRLSLVLVVLLAFLALSPLGAAEPARTVRASLLRPAPEADPVVVGRPDVVRIALRYLGTPYRWAGAAPAGFDCSGFVMYVYSRVGIGLPHNSTMLWDVGRFVPRDRLEPGDVVFFNGLSHVGIYIGHGKFVHSPRTGDVVKVSRLAESWYGSTYDGARRYGRRR
jgi:cell wall-associated NlpC family hydrolase